MKKFIKLLPLAFTPLSIMACTPFQAIKTIIPITNQPTVSNPLNTPINPDQPLNSIISAHLNPAAISLQFGTSDISPTRFLQSINNAEKQIDSIRSSFNISQNQDPENILYSAMVWSYVPGINSESLNNSFDFKVELVPNSADDYFGTIKVKVKAYKKNTSNKDQPPIQQRVFVVSGFKSTFSGHYLFKQRIQTAFSQITDLQLKNDKHLTDLNQLNPGNFWEYFNIPSNFEKLDASKFASKETTNILKSIQNPEPYKEDVAKNDIRLKAKHFYYLKATLLQNSYNSEKHTFDALLTIYHDNYTNSFSKIVPVKLQPSSANQSTSFKPLIANPNFSLKSAFSNFLPTFFIRSNFVKDNDDLSKFIDLTGFDKNTMNLRIVDSLVNDQDGSFYVWVSPKTSQNSLKTNSQGVQIGQANGLTPGQIIKVSGFNSYNKIFASPSFTNQIDYSFIDKWYKLPDEANLEKKLDNLSLSLNSSTDNLIWPLFGKAILNSIQNSGNLFNNIGQISGADKSDYSLSSLADFKVSKEGISFYFANWLGDYYKISVKFNNVAQPKNIVADFGDTVYTTEQIEKDLRSRSLAIQIKSVEKQKGSNELSIRSTSGTAWIFDRKMVPDPSHPGKLKGTNTYFLATNMHVIADLLNRPDQIFSFSYLLNGDTKDFSTFSFDDDSLFRRFDRVVPNPLDTSQFFPEDGLKYVNDTSKEFWKNLKIDPIGLDSPEKSQFRDIAIIQVTFPEDQVIKLQSRSRIERGFLDFFGDLFDDLQPKEYEQKIKNIPDAARYYNDHPLQFLITNKIKFEDFNVSEKIEPRQFSQPRFEALPIRASLGGFLGGHRWITDTRNAFIGNLSYKRDRDFDNYGTKQYQSARSISLPGLKGGHGMSGSLVVNEYNQVLGIFWGGVFPETSASSSKLVTGIGEFAPIGLKVDDDPSILAKWLEQTKNITTELDKYEQKVFQLEDPKKLAQINTKNPWISFSPIVTKLNKLI